MIWFDTWDKNEESISYWFQTTQGKKCLPSLRVYLGRIDISGALQEGCLGETFGVGTEGHKDLEYCMDIRHSPIEDHGLLGAPTTIASRGSSPAFQSCSSEATMTW